MSQIPRRPGGIPIPRIVTASATVTKKDPASNKTVTEQRNRIAAIKSCCGGAEGGAAGQSQIQHRLSRMPPPCCTSQSKIAKPCDGSTPRATPIKPSGIPRSAPSSSRRTDSKSVEPSQQQVPPRSDQTMTPPRPVPSFQETVPKLLRSKQIARKSPFPPRPYGIMGTSPATTYTPTQTTSKPSKMEDTIREGLFRKSILKPLSKVSAKGKQSVKAPPETIETPAGVEPVLQKAVFEKRIEREKQGETFTKNVTISNLNERNEMDVVEMGVQQMDPKFAKMDGKEIIGVTSTISVTPSYTTVAKDYIRALTEEKGDLGLTPEEVSRLVEEETEDVENTLKMIPPDLVLSPGRYEIKQRLQQLRINSESVALLEQSIIQPEVTADEAQYEPSPEAMAGVMHTVETGITPEATPDQVFNSLFQEPPNENYIKLSSVTPGPLQDVVVPTEIPKEIHKEAVTDEMSKLTEKLNNMQPQDVPYVDIFTRVMGADPEYKYPEKGKNKPRQFETITDERSLWVNANLEHLVNVVGAEPMDVLDPFNLDDLERSENLVQEMANGMDYFVETNPVQYINRVQLRGSQQPSYFPGYNVAVPDFPDLMKIVQSPDEVFAIAWKSVQPKYFDEESMMSLLV
ncbi:uncharacterized protein LOC114328344 [Diabrotica virgifera virgifera]|uniref:Uncharacterized protein LOC114328344 n=1 Tax=Diabrotica virgifera virgifera TaxID=50390 RepID=A0A6P7FID6_DIAVI|nr:uncharacterized protein LOC114328344 [Diabrotica virgifera virgifera]